MKYLLPSLFFLLISCQPDSNNSTTNQSIEETIPEVVEDIPKKLIVPDTAYVTAKSGLRVRDEASLDGARIGVRPYGKKVLITHRTGKTMTIKDEGKDISGEWVGIETRLVNKGNVEMVTGYIFSGFLTDKQPLDNGVILANLSRMYPFQGIGGIITKLEGVRRYSFKNKNAGNDTLKIYKDDLKTVLDIANYHFLQLGNRRYIKGDYHNCRHGKNRIQWSHDLGLGNFPTVKEIKDGFAFLGNYCGENMWINLNELDDKLAQFKTHMEIFEANPNGGGWEKGYTYKGLNKVLRAEPSLNSKAILNNIPPEYEIYIIGKVKDGWAKVKVKEAKHIFGEMYFKKSIYGKTWEGWIMIAEPDGTPLIAPHIFGC